MRKKRIGRIAVDLMIVIAFVLQSVVPASAAEIPYDDMISGDSITAGEEAVVEDEILQSGSVEVEQEEEEIVTEEELPEENYELELIDDYGEDNAIEISSGMDEDMYEALFVEAGEIRKYASASLISMTKKEYLEKVDSFINDPQWSDGTKWGSGKPHQIGSWSSSGCAGYAHDFVCYVYGRDGSFDTYGEKITSIDEIKTGDVIWITTPKNSYEHYFVVLERNGNNLKTAEGNHFNTSGNDVRIANAGYQIISDKEPYIYMNDLEVETGRCGFKVGYRFANITGNSPNPDDEMDEPLDRIKDYEKGEYAIVSALSLEKTGKITKDAIVMDVDKDIIYPEKELNSKTTLFEFERLDNGFYQILDADSGDAIYVEDASKKEKAEILIDECDESETASNWTFDEFKPDQFLIDNKHSALSITVNGGRSKIWQMDEYPRNDDDEDAQIWLFVSPDTPEIKTSEIPDSKVGQKYSKTLVLKSDCDERLALEWGLTSDSGQMPAGLSISKAGVISGTPTKAGNYKIKVYAETAFGRSTAAYNIAITDTSTVPVSSVTLNKTTAELKVGDTVTLSANVLPTNATNPKVSWKSNKTGVATVDNNGKVTAVSEGEATITAASTDGSNKSASCKITVTETMPAGIAIKAGKITGQAGKTVSVPVSISGNTGIGGFQMTVSYDEALTLTGIEKGSLLSSGTFNSDAKTGLIQWYTSDKAVRDNGVLFTLIFSVKTGTAAGDYPVNISLKDGLKANITDENSTILDVTFISGTVSVKKIIKGDVTHDGEVAIGDVVKVARAVSGSATLTNDEKAAADVTGDGEVAIGDVVKIARYVEGSVTEL